ncbi:MAG: putative lipid II flippase FtsW [Spirochaetaceae bacterium]|nr:putative lipid II flippase FtsW [Spirochaetaceae bacterium]MBR3813091.1 putative lipid II flippase FtsW [Spirochaetaceae bacterium]MDD6485553.1 putative lipid II flippase FtsW [Spirochaetales bacterium]
MLYGSFFPSSEKIIIGKKADIGFLVSFILLLGLGLVTLYSVSINPGMRIKNDELFFVKRQIAFLLVGSVVVFFLSMVDLDRVRNILPAIVLFSIFLCLLTCIPGIGIEKNGARRWLGIAGIEFQSSEPAKLVIVLYLAHLFAKKHDKLDELAATIIPAVIMTSVFVVFIYLQNDFSTSLIVMILSFVLFFFSGIKLRWFVIFFCLVLPVVLLFVFTEPYRVERIISFLNPSIDPYGGGYQLNMARKAISGGGFWGKGIGGLFRGSVSIPEVQSDFIFAGWAEEMGFFGIMLYFVVLTYFVVRGYKIALSCEDRFRSLLAFGCVSAILIQSLMNCGVVCGLFPSTGIPLPFFSSGGTSLIVSMSFCGLIINVSRWNKGEGD